MFTGLRIKAEKEGKTWRKLKNCNIYDVNAEGFKVDINVESDLSGVLYLGTSKFSMLKEFEGKFSVDKYTFTVTGLEKSKIYYFYIKNTSDNEYGRSGIYKQKTTIKVPIDIIIGSEAIDRSSAIGTHTLVNKGVVASGTGKIKSVEIWASTTLQNCKVAIFFVESENYLSTRAYQIIGEVEKGSKKTFIVELPVEKGDYIGIYYNVGGIENDTAGGEGIWYTANEDSIPCTNKLFSFFGGYILSLYGKGIG